MADITQVARLSGLPSTPAETKVPSDKVDAAAQFERVLVKQFVQVMTKDLFKSGEEEGMSWMGSYGDIQRDTLADVLTDHLVEAGTFKLQDLLLRQWGRQAAEASDESLIRE
jgi:peptidoglycan hydrolase FlgJ